MPTQLRRDLTPQDIHVASRFKALIIKRVPKPRRFSNTEVQMWSMYNLERVWIEDIRKVDIEPCAGVPINDFKKVIAAIGRENSQISPGYVFAVLKKMSLLRWRGTSFKVEEPAHALVLIEWKRIWGDGTIKKRRPNAPGVLLEIAESYVDQMVAEGMPFDAAESAVNASANLFALRDLVKKNKDEQIDKRNRLFERAPW